jgi:hypothetical protein
MANFAERIAYWYMRLNGCLLLENYVNHRRPDIAPSDTDLLAVRLRYTQLRVWEGPPQVDDWSARFGVDVTESSLALVVQAKGGGGDPARAFTEDRLTDAVQRIGALDPGAARDVVNALREARHAASGGWLLLKLVIGPTGVDCAHHVSLDEAHQFVRARFRDYPRKRSDWHHFPDPIVQLIAWEETGRG